MFMYPDGKCYKGHWKNGLQHGEGTFVNPNSKLKLRYGIWEQGKRLHWTDAKPSTKSSLSKKNFRSPSPDTNFEIRPNSSVKNLKISPQNSKS